MPASHCPVPKWLRDGYTKSKMQNSVLYRTMPYYHRVPSCYLLVSYLHLRALSGAPCIHFVVRKYSLVCQRICQNNHGVASTCYLLATSVFHRVGSVHLRDDNVFAPYKLFLALFPKFSHFSPLSPLFPTFSHFSPLFTTFHHFSPLFPNFPHFFPLFPTFSHFSPLFTTFHHFPPLFPSSSNYSPLFGVFHHF